MTITTKPSLSVPLLLLFSAMASADEGSFQLKEGAGKNLVMGHCAICHSLDYIQMNSPILDRAGWEKTVNKMVALGAEIAEPDKQAILDYLARHYGSDKSNRQ